jgi:hypothetical protein
LNSGFPPPEFKFCSPPRVARARAREEAPVNSGWWHDLRDVVDVDVDVIDVAADRVRRHEYGDTPGFIDWKAIKAITWRWAP